MSNVQHYLHYDDIGKAVKELVIKNPDQNFLILFK